jgi:hypothetical protein
VRNETVKVSFRSGFQALQEDTLDSSLATGLAFACLEIRGGFAGNAVPGIGMTCL